MYPVLFSVGGAEVRAYGVLLFLATLVGLWLLTWRARRIGLPIAHVTGFGVGAVVCGLAGARLWEIASHWSVYATSGDGMLIALAYGGLAAPGGIIGLILWTGVFAQRTHTRIGDWLEALTPIIPVVEGLARWGCFLNGCCYGKETASLLGLYLPDLDRHWAMRYPTQIAYSLFALTIAGTLWWLSRRPWATGRLFPIFLMLYGVDYFILDFWRADVVPVWGGLTGRQMAALVAMSAGAAIWLRTRRRRSGCQAPLRTLSPVWSPSGRVRWWILGAVALLSLTVLGCGYRSIAIEANEGGPVIVRTRYEIRTDQRDAPDCTLGADQTSGVLGANTQVCQPFVDAGTQSVGCDCVLTYRRIEDFNAHFRITVGDGESQETALTARLSKQPSGYRMTASIKPATLWLTSYVEGGTRHWTGPMTFSVRMPGRITGHTEPRYGKLERVSVDGQEIRWQFRGAEENWQFLGAEKNDEPAETYTLTVDSERGDLALGWWLGGAGLLIIGVSGSLAWWFISRGQAARPVPVPAQHGSTQFLRTQQAMQPSVTIPDHRQVSPHIPVAALSELASATGYPAIGQTLGKYVLRELVGRGGMAAVYRATHTLLGRNVALKVLAPHLTSHVDFVHRFHREGQMLASLAHPNIVIVYDAGYDDGYYYLAMEYIEGESLAQRLARKRVLPQAEVIWIGRAITAALAYAHAQGIIHRDIKPANVLLTRDKHLKVADFGIAALMSQGVTLMAGTPGYMPPEGALGVADARSDIYSTGALLYHLVTGQAPTPDSVRAPLAANQLVAGLSPELGKIIDRALQPDPTRRFQSALEMHRALEHAQSTLSYKV